MQRLIFEYSPAFIFLCILIGLIYAYVLYQSKYHWSKRINQLLFGLRTLLVTLIAFLLLGPVIKLTKNLFEKPAFVFLIDDSASIREVTDSLQRQKLLTDIEMKAQELKDRDYDVSIRGLSEQRKITFKYGTSDLSGAIRSVASEYEGKNLAGIVLVSDGIYNSGTSPVYLPLRVPVYSIGLGDTTERVDLSLKNIAFNKIAYQGNKFPIRAEVLVKGLPNQNVTVSLLHSGKLITKLTQNSGSKSLLQFDFQAEAVEKGIQRLDLIIDSHANETNARNNRSGIFVEVVEGKKKILVIAPAPHPDIKALRAVIEENSNYEFHLHIPGVKENPTYLQPGDVDLAIFQQVLDESGKTTALYTRFNQSPTSVMTMLTSKSSLRQLAANGIPLTFESVGQTDEVMPVINDQFRDFSFSENVNTVLSKYPPVSVPFGKLNYPATAQVLLWQRIGNVTTNRPLLLSWDDASKKRAVLIGEGIWKWRLNEYDDHASTESFDEVFGKLIQYLSTKDDKRKFKSFPLQNEFTDAESVVFESQVFNDLFEPIYGNKINLELRDDKGKVTPFSYMTGSGNQRYRLGVLKEGVYKYKASTELNGKTEEVRGEFLVSQQNIESQNLTADFGLLRKLSSETGGKFYPLAQLDQVTTGIEKSEAKSIIHSEDSYNSIINLKIVFFLLLLLVSAEWFTRKFMGAY
ncbi:MAG TPA: hypothetical protein VIT44_00090 [Cyclobacteriaceae bacterium]